LAGGFQWSEKDSKLDEFLAGNIGARLPARDVDATSKAIRALFDQIRPGDEFAIKALADQRSPRQVRRSCHKD